MRRTLFALLLTTILSGCDGEDAVDPNWPPADLQSTPEKAMTTYFEARMRRDIETTLKVMDPAIVQAYKDADDPNAFNVLKYSIIRSPKSVTWTKKDEWTIRGDEAFVTIELKIAAEEGDEPKIETKQFGCTRKD